MPIESFSDRRSEGWFLVENPPIPILTVLIGYVVMINFGPTLMKDRRAYEMKHIMMIYNLFQVIANLFINIYVSIAG